MKQLDNLVIEHFNKLILNDVLSLTFIIILNLCIEQGPLFFSSYVP